MAGPTTREGGGSVNETEKAADAVTVPASAVEAASSAASGTAAAGPAVVAEKSNYQNFLDKLRHASGQGVVNGVRDFVKDFPLDLTRLQAAQRVHDFLAVTAPKLIACAAFAEDKSREARRANIDNLERFVLTKLHKDLKVLYVTLPVDMKQDELAHKMLQEKREASGGRESLGPELSEESQDNFAKAADCLREVSKYQIPSSKLICMLNAHRLVGTVAEELRFVREASASNTTEDFDKAEGGDNEDDIRRRVLEALIVEASPPKLYSDVEFTAAFRHPPLTTAEDRRCLIDFSAALGVATGITPKVPTLAIGAGGSWTWGGFEELPLWLEGTGVSFRYEAAEAGNLLLGEVDELLSAYHRMASVLHSLAENPDAAK